MIKELTEQIKENAAGPAKVSGDAGSVEQRKLTDQIAVYNHLANKDAVNKKRRGMRFNKLVPPVRVKRDFGF